MAWCGPRRPAPGRRPARRDLPVRRRGSGRSPRSGRKLNRRGSPALRPGGRTADAQRGVRGGSTGRGRAGGAHPDALADALAAVGDYARRLRHAPVAPFDPEPLMTARDAAAVTPSQASTRPPSCTSPGDSPSAFGRWSRRSPPRTWVPRPRVPGGTARGSCSTRPPTSAPARPAEPVCEAVDRAGQRGEQVLDLVAGQRDQPVQGHHGLLGAQGAQQCFRLGETGIRGN